jgi:hypothetical protein
VPREAPILLTPERAKGSEWTRLPPGGPSGMSSPARRIATPHRGDAAATKRGRISRSTRPETPPTGAGRPEKFRRINVGSRLSLAGQLAQRLVQRERRRASAPSPRLRIGACRHRAFAPVRAPVVSVRAPVPTGALRPDVCCALGHRRAPGSSAADQLPTASPPGAHASARLSPENRPVELFEFCTIPALRGPSRGRFGRLGPVRGASKIAVLLTCRVAAIRPQRRHLKFL